MTRDISSYFLGEELGQKEMDKDTALFHVLPCGLEKTVSYGTGTAKGPEAIIAASHQLERIIDGHEPVLHGIYTCPPPDLSGTPEQIMQLIAGQTEQIAAQGAIPVTLGGEHALSYGAVMGVRAALASSGDEIGIIQIDAHADLRVAYQGNHYSHASVMHLLADEGVAIAQLGVRALCAEEMAARQHYRIISHDASELVRNNISAIDLPDSFPEKLYISFDLDGLDPSILPATGTPVPGGLGYYQALDLVASATKGRQIVGMDIVELAPDSAHRPSDFVAASICYHLMAIASTATGDR
jgi:agmatinase